MIAEAKLTNDNAHHALTGRCASTMIYMGCGNACGLVQDTIPFASRSQPSGHQQVVEWLGEKHGEFKTDQRPIRTIVTSLESWYHLLTLKLSTSP